MRLLFILPLLLLFSCNYVSLNDKNITHGLIDSIKKISSENLYVKNLIKINSQRNLIKMPVIENAYDVADTGKTQPISIFNKISKKTLVVRYTSVGCNSCADLLFKKLNANKQVSDNYDILVLADYSDYIYFLKWYKIAEVNQRVLWLKKGSLPLDLEYENVSYTFVIDTNNNVSSIFIPNKLFEEQITAYLYLLQ